MTLTAEQMIRNVEIAAEFGDERRTRWTAADLVATEFPDPRWAVPGIIGEGLTVLAGPPKAGKSWLALQTALARATGGMALGKIEVEQSDVLYLALEDNPRRLRTRLEMMLGNEPAPRNLVIETEWPRFGDDCTGRLDDYLGEHPDTDVIIDVYAKIREVIPDRGSMYQADYAEAAALKKLADDHGVPILLLHHVRKAASEDFVETVSGTNGVTGCADSVLVLRRSRTSVDGILSVTGRDIEEAEHALRFDSQRGLWTVLGPASQYALTDERRRVLELVKTHGQLKPAQVADLTGMKRDNARQLLRRMALNDELTSDGKGNYAAPPVTPVTQSLNGDTVTGVTPLFGGVRA